MSKGEFSGGIVLHSATAQFIHLFYRDVISGAGGIFPLNLYEKMYYVSVLSDTAVDVKIRCENTAKW